MRKLVCVVCLGLLACGRAPSNVSNPVAVTAAAPTREQARELWKKLRRDLVGTWKAKTESGKLITESFRLVSADSLLLETFLTPSGRETMSVYHPDRDSVVLTHYCAQGNQPRLRAMDITDNGATFRYFDATNVLPDQAILVERRLLLGENSLEQTEVYRQPDGSSETTVLRFLRVVESAHSPE